MPNGKDKPTNPRISGTAMLRCIVGPMFAGKTHWLIRMHTGLIADSRTVFSFIHELGVYDGVGHICSREGVGIPAHVVSDSNEILEVVGTPEDRAAVLIDECQFFDGGLVPACEDIAMRGIDVIAAGLDTDYLGVPFATTAGLLCVSDYVHKIAAVCCMCGLPATRTYRTQHQHYGNIILPGNDDLYHPMCVACHTHALVNTENA